MRTCQRLPVDGLYNSGTRRRDFRYSMINAAALGGHQHVIAWARENGCDWSFTTSAQAA